MDIRGLTLQVLEGATPLAAEIGSLREAVERVMEELKKELELVVGQIEPE